MRYDVDAENVAKEQNVMANFAMGMKKKCTTNKDLDVENISKTN